MNKKISIGILLCVLITILISTSIINSKSFDNNFIYNGYSEEFVFDDNNYIFTKDISPKIINKSNSNVYNFNLDVFSNEQITPMYSDGENTFFLSLNSNNSSYKIGYYDSKFNVHYLIGSANDYDNIGNNLFDKMFSKNDYLSMTEDHFNTPTQFVVVDKNIYLYCPGGVFKYNILTKIKTPIFKDKTCETSFSYSNGYIYFQDSTYKLYAYNISANKLECLDSITPYNFCVNKNGILFSDLNNQMKLSFYDFKTAAISVINNKETQAFDIDENNIFFYYNGDYYKSDLKGNNEKVLSQGPYCAALTKGVNDLYISFDSNDGIKTEVLSLK